MTDTLLRPVQVLPTLNAGGAEKIALAHAQGLKASGIDNFVISLSPEGTGQLEQEFRSTATVINVPKPRGKNLLTPLKLELALRRIGASLVHSHLYILPYLAISIFLQRRGHIHTIHNVPERETTPFGKFLHKQLFRYGVQPVAVAPSIAEASAKLYPSCKIHSIPNGIPIPPLEDILSRRTALRNQLGLSSDRIVFVCVAGFRPTKNHSALIRNFQAVAQNHSDAFLLLVGDGECRNAVQEQVVKAGISQHVHFAGFRENVFEFLAASDVFVLFSKWEGNPLAVMEGMAARLPVIAPAVGGLPDITDKSNAILVPVEDESALIAAMEFFIQNPAARASFGNAARAQAEREFSAAAMTRHYQALYTSTLRSI